MLDLIHKPGSDNMGGTQLIAWAIPHSQILSFPEEKLISFGFSSINVLRGDIIPGPFFQFMKIFASPDSGEVLDEKVEGIDMNVTRSLYKFKFPSTDMSSIGFARISPTTKWVFLVLENNGVIRMLGNKKTPAILSADTKLSTGTSSGNELGGSYSIQSYQEGAAPIYSGWISYTEDPGSKSLYPCQFTSSEAIEFDVTGRPLKVVFKFDHKLVFTHLYTYNAQGLVISTQIVTGVL